MTRYQFSNIYVLAAFGTIGGGLFGFDISSMSAWIGTKAYLDYFNKPDEGLQGGITASMSAGSWIGALLAGWISDKYGRIKTLQLASIIWIIGSIITLSAQNVAHLVAGRVICGFCVGITSSQTPVYMAELAHKNIRGRIVGTQQLAIELGILVMFFISYGCTFVSGPTGFRIAWGVQAIPAIVLIIALFFFPESPRWLASKDRWEECLQVLAHLHAKGDVNDPLVLAEYEEVREAQMIATQAKTLSWMGLFSPEVWRCTVVGCFAQIWQQLLGGNVMMYYIVYVFQMAGLTGNVNLYSSSIQYVIFLFTTAVTLIFFIDKIGRRPLLLVGAVLMAALNFTVAGVMGSYGNPVDEVDGNANITWQVTGPPAKAVIACTYLFVAVYGFTWAPVVWIYVSEIFPLQYRARGVGLATSCNWAFNFALAYFVPPAFHNIQWKSYLIFGVFCLCGLVHAFVMFPETKGRTLEEIEDLFKGTVPAWRSHEIESRLEQRAHEISEKGPTDVKEVEHVGSVKGEA